MFKDKLSLIPHAPGSYQMLDKDGVIIYVGKAKDLHKRVSSYFNRTQTGKTAKLVSEIADFTYIVATSELEAFLIEINLIKKYDPKYNILLTDDKSYPYIEYIKKPYPKLKISRYLTVKKKDNKLLFGPYPNSYAARRIVNLINRLYPLKKCEGIKKEVCLYYHIGECLGYCQKKIDEDKIKVMENEILSFLRGNDNILKSKILEKIKIFSENLNYEMALELKNELNYIDIIMNKQKIELHDYTNRDVIGYYTKNGYASITILFIRNGKLVGSKNHITSITDNEIDELEYYISKFYIKNEIPKEILLSNELDIDLLSKIINTKIISPQKGIKKQLLEMAIMNAKISLENEYELIKKDEEKTEKSNEELGNLLNIPSLNRIDIFDNSNLFGDFSVSGMVVFINGKPAKKEYRKYKITLDKNDDYHTMQEVIYRRYQRALVDQTKLPELIIVDGGENQINAATSILQQLNLNIKVVGLKKDNHHRTNALINSNLEEIDIPKDSNVFFYLTRMQDEVHRFTINYHRQLRSKKSIKSLLDDIDGIGPKRKKELLNKFGSLIKIKEASDEELRKVIPEKIIPTLREFLKNYHPWWRSENLEIN